MNGSIAQGRTPKHLTSPSKRRMVQSLTVSEPGPNRPTASRWIPVPDVPVRPVLSAGAFFGRRTARLPCVLDQGQRLEVSAGRVAIARALEMMNLSPGDRVLVPAYHCASMIDPLAWRSAEPVFYRIKASLMADDGDIEAKIDCRTRAVMITHYFGFPQDLMRIRDLCDRRGLFLIEDCAHSMFGMVEGRPIGSVGDFAITSLTKFLPVGDGGALVTSNSRVKSVTLKAQGAKASLMEAFGIFQEATYYNRLRITKPLVKSGEIAKAVLAPIWTSPSSTTNPARVRSGQQGDMDWSWIDIRSSVVSDLISRFVSKDRVVRRRIANYRRLAEGFKDIPGCHPILPNVPNGVVPYMFPLWVDDLDRVFPMLEDRAIPMQRFGQFLWPGVDHNLCPESAAFSKHLVQLPCHQELTNDELNWLVSSVTATMRAT